ncbi:MAG: hypothetical protein LBI15_00615 [Dysgonamonadaceae bacterium]|jgi:hypothetical protein|nr:hypothetical protein [Dysgonamonadaceae bacterium]
MKKIMKLFIATLIMFPLASIGCSDNDTDSLAKVTSLKVSNAEDNIISLIEGDTKQVEIVLYPDESVDKAGYTFKYSSTDVKVFTVDENGVITATGVGEAALRIDAVNNTDMWTICIVSVEERIYPVTSIEIPAEFKVHYIGVEQSFDLGAITVVNPENATNPDVIFISSNEELAFVDENGVIYTRDLFGDVTITVRATDGSNVEATCELRIRNVVYNDLTRTGWNVMLSEAHTPVNIINGTMTDAFGGFPHQMIDGVNPNTGIIIVKPNAVFAGITGGSYNAYFVLDMGSSQNYNYFRLRHRTNNTSANLRASAVAVFGSNNGEEFTQIIERAAIPTAVAINEARVDLPETVNYRYLKIEIVGFLPAPGSGNTIQISDFNVGLSSFED